MKKTDAIRDMFSALSSPDWAVVRDAVERTSDWLRAELGSVMDVDLSDLGAKLVDLAGHPKWEVRKAVAHAAQYLRHETFHIIVARLLKDDNTWVRDAARRTLARRSELTRADILTEQHGDLLMGWLSDFEGQYGQRARDAAMGVAGKYAELIVREAYHEIVKVISPLDVSLMNLENGIGRARVDRISCSRHVARARERLRLLTAIVDSLRALTTEVTPEFRGEGLREMLYEALALVRDEVQSEGGTLVAEFTVDPALRLDAHRYRLLQAFSNIMRNAFEAYDGAADRRRRLGVEARVLQEGQVVVAFEDFGCGMSEEALRDAFQLYSTSKPDGTGFGLPLAKKIIEGEHRGSITLASVKGKGTTVTVVLPMEQEQLLE